MAKKTTKKKKTKSKTKSLVKKEYTDEEKARLAKHQERAGRKLVKFKTVKSDSRNPQIAIQNLDEPLLAVKMSEALGTADPDLQGHLLDQIVQTFRGTVSSDGAENEATAAAANKTMAILTGIQPQDEIEGMLAVQMIGVHNMAMECMSRAVRTQWVNQQKDNINGATKLLRTFATQMEVLKKYRTGGQQKIVVEHVNALKITLFLIFSYCVFLLCDRYTLNRSASWQFFPVYQSTKNSARSSRQARRLCILSPDPIIVTNFHLIMSETINFGCCQ